MGRQIRRAALRIQICGDNDNSESTVREGLLMRGVERGSSSSCMDLVVDGGKLKRSSQLCLISVIESALVCGLLAA